MKKLVILVAIAVIICFAAVLSKAQEAVQQEQQPDAVSMQIQESMSECNLFFSQMLDHKMIFKTSAFEDQIEDVLNADFFWQTCIEQPLKNGQNITIKYIGYTADAKPTKKQIKRLLKSAAIFKDELEDYIEDQEPKDSFWHEAEKYILLKADSLNLEKVQKLKLNKENMKFNPSLKNGKIFIDVMTEKNQQNAGAILVQTHI